MLFRRREMTNWILLAATVCGLALTSAYAGRHWDGREIPEPEEKQPKLRSGSPGNLAIIDLKVFELSHSGTHRRYLARALVENQSPVTLDAQWNVQFRERGGSRLNGVKAIVGSCGAHGLPRGQVAVCEAWLPSDMLEEGDLVEAKFDRRGLKEFAKWDGDQSNDVATAVVETIVPGESPLRIAEWSVRPRVLHGKGEVQFRFSVEGAHLAWLLVEGEEPRLLAGHPADGLISGASTAHVKQSGPVTIVARNSLGAFVYAAIPVLNTYDPPKPVWIEMTGQGADEPDELVEVLEPGVYEVDDNNRVLKILGADLSRRDWTRALSDLDLVGDDLDHRPPPIPANVLNPKARKRR